MFTDAQDVADTHYDANVGRLAAHPASVYSAFHRPNLLKTRDGVFSNMVSSSGISQISNLGISQISSGTLDAVPSRPPCYEEVATMRPPNYSIEAPAIFRLLSGGNNHNTSGFAGTSSGRPPSIADILIDGIPLGSWSSFFGPMAVVVVSQFVGFLLTLMLVRSHAGHHGAFAGLGLLLAIFAFNGGFESASSSGFITPTNDRLLDSQSLVLTTSVLDPFLLVSVIVVGLALFFFSFYSYARLRSKAASSLSQLQSMEQQA
ncbi:WW domain binding [Mitosporidium daphniae]